MIWDRQAALIHFCGDGLSTYLVLFYDMSHTLDQQYQVDKEQSADGNVKNHLVLEPGRTHRCLGRGTISTGLFLYKRKQRVRHHPYEYTTTLTTSSGAYTWLHHLSAFDTLCINASSYFNFCDVLWTSSHRLRPGALCSVCTQGKRHKRP